MKKFWYLPIAAVAGAASLTVWAQANAGPPPAVSPGVVVADVQSGSGTAKPGEQPALLATPTPTPTSTPSITAIPDHTAPETQRIQVELQTYPPLQPTHSPTHGVGDDKGGLRPDGVSDDGPLHDVGDDKGGLRPDGVSDDGPLHDLGDDKGGLRDDSESDDGPGDDKGGDR
jgi:hypothetical protein